MGASSSNEISTPYQGSGITGVFPNSKGSTTILPPHMYPRDHEDGNFNPAVAISLDKAPTALVVGAGMAGVHMAYELATRGFKVSVVDSNSQVGLGSTAFSNPIIGDRLRPFVFEKFSFKAAVASALFGTSSAGGLLFEDKNAVLLSNVKCFRAVRKSLTCETKHLEAMFNEMSEETASIVRELTTKYPSLRSSVVVVPASQSLTDWLAPLPISTKSSGSTATLPPKRKKDDQAPAALEMDPAMSDWSLSPLAGASLESSDTGEPQVASGDGNSGDGNTLVGTDRLLMNPLKWTRTLANICRNDLGVEFHLNTDLFHITTKEHRDGFDVISQVVVDARQGGLGSLSARRVLTADVYVLAAGTGLIPSLNHLVGEVPLIPVDGLAVVMPRPTRVTASNNTEEINSKQSELQKVLAAGVRSTRAGNPLKLAAGSISNNGSTFVVPFDRNSFAGRPGGPIDEVAICGTSTITAVMRSSVAEPDTTVIKALKKLCKGGLPVEWREGVLEVAGPAGESKGRANGVQVLRYPRAVTPDGLPLVSRVGPIFNAFVLGGFHDNICALAPSCSRTLAKMVQHPTKEELASPLSLTRYMPDSIRLKPRDPEPTPEQLIDEKRRTRGSLGMYDHVCNALNHWISIPVQTAIDTTAFALYQSDIFGSAFKDWLYLNYITLEQEELVRGGPIEDYRSYPDLKISADTINAPSAVNPLYAFKEGHRVLSAGREIVEIPLTDAQKKERNRHTP